SAVSQRSIDRQHTHGINVEQNRERGKCRQLRRGSCSPSSNVCVSLEPKSPRSQSRFETLSRPARKLHAGESFASLPFLSRALLFESRFVPRNISPPSPGPHHSLNWSG